MVVNSPHVIRIVLLNLSLSIANCPLPYNILAQNPNQKEKLLTKENTAVQPLNAIPDFDFVAQEVRIAYHFPSRVGVTENLVERTLGVLRAVVDVDIFEQPTPENTHSGNRHFSVNRRLILTILNI